MVLNLNFQTLEDMSWIYSVYYNMGQQLGLWGRVRFCYQVKGHIVGEGHNVNVG